MATAILIMRACIALPGPNGIIRIMASCSSTLASSPLQGARSQSQHDTSAVEGDGQVPVGLDEIAIEDCRGLPNRIAFARGLQSLGFKTI